MSVTETEQEIAEQSADSKGKKTARDYFVIVLCILGVCASLFMFQRDMFRTFRSSSPTAGIVTAKQNTVMRLLSDIMVWDRLYTQAPVYNGDLVYIARLSGATLKLGSDGTDGIELGEYTMIRIHSSSRVDLISGSANISVRSNRGFQLAIGDNVIEASSGTVLNASSDDGFTLRVRAGDARVIRDGQVQTAPAGSIIILNTQGDSGSYLPEARPGDFLPALDLRLPTSEGFVVIGDDSEDHYFTWVHSLSAEYYLFQISANRDLSNPIISEKLRENYYVYRKGETALSPGRYYWSVLYVDAAGNTSPPSEMRTFTATTDKNQQHTENSGLTFTEVTEPVQTAVVENALSETVSPAPVERQQQTSSRLTLQAPANNAAIAGLTALRQPTTFRWSTDEDLTSSRFVLSRRNNPTVGRAEIEITNPGRTLTVPRIGEGVWYWTVEGRTRDGRTVTSAPRQLRVQTIPLLPAPRNRLPASGYQIGADEFRQNRAIVFSWAQVSGANSYILTIMKDAIPRKIQIFQTDPIRGLSYTLENYSMFDDSGSYSWRVEAVFYNSNSGVIEQRGNQGENNFSLDVPLPSRVHPRSTGVLYGTQ
ncbi:MAG: hypothetical protein LBI28_14360 [Treponema sp.]|jgi:hypothetical protein|nr:hypothetical protein [Treponema sp.]